MDKAAGVYALYGLPVEEERDRTVGSRKPLASTSLVMSGNDWFSEGRTLLKLHHLEQSRSQRILWLLEELGLEYELVFYKRDPETWLAPAQLKEISPLGKSPVLEDGGRMRTESGAIIDYLVRRHGGGRLAPNPASDLYDDYVHWLHYAEGSAMLPMMLTLYVGRLGEAGAPLQPRIRSESANHLGYIEQTLKAKEFIVGEHFSAADIQITFVLDAARRFGYLDSRPALGSYLDRMHARPAHQRALELGEEAGEE